MGVVGDSLVAYIPRACCSIKLSIEWQCHKLSFLPVPVARASASIRPPVHPSEPLRDTHMQRQLSSCPVTFDAQVLLPM
jgi:hypothetical protein